MTFKPWIPPAGEVVDPPVHPMTIVDVIYSDGGKIVYHPADAHNWSGEGDGPKIIAYSVVEEYVEKPEPREWWLARDCVFYSRFSAEVECRAYEPGAEIIHVREVLPEAPLDDDLISQLQNALIWCSGSNDFQEGGVAREGWLRLCAPLLAGVAPSAAPAKPAPREVVAWAVVERDGQSFVFNDEDSAFHWRKRNGGTVVKLSGFLPCE